MTCGPALLMLQLNRCKVIVYTFLYYHACATSRNSLWLLATLA
jgi:hypothetical protein